MVTRLKNGLTPKQNKLQTILLQQIKETGETNLSQAGLQVYNTDNRKVAHEIAKDAMESTGMKERIDKAMETAGLTPSLILDNLKDLAVREVDKVSADVKLKTNIELLKLMGAYPGSKHARLNINIKGSIKDMNMKEVDQRLKEVDNELQEVMEEANSNTIEPKEPTTTG